MRSRRILALLLTFLFLFFVLPAIYPPVRRAPAFIRLMLKDAPSRLPTPVKGVKPRNLRDTWGAARSGGRRHEGIDIFARRNTPVVSATEGLVSKVGLDELGGRVVVITGPAGWSHYYAHLEKFGHLEPGDWVERGDVIGYVGNSGNARGTPPHLHYGIYPLGRGAINPYPLLVRPTHDSLP